MKERAATPTPKRKATGARKNLLVYILKEVSPRHGIFVVASLLTFLGLWNIHSITVATQGSSLGAISKQLLALGLGALGGMYMYYKTRYQNLVPTRTYRFFLFVCILLLIAVLFSEPINGARRWIQLPGGSTFQPSELAKFLSIIWCAHYLAAQVKRTHSLHIVDWTARVLPHYLRKVMRWLRLDESSFVQSWWESSPKWRCVLPVPDWSIYPLLCGIFIFLEPDFGTVLLTVGFPMMMWMVAGAPKEDLKRIGIMGGVLVVFLAMVSTYRRARIEAFWDPWSVALGSGYQAVQSMVAVGTGGFLGFSGNGGTGKFAYLPEIRTDFAFASYCQDHGMVGALLVILLFLLFTIYGIRTALEAFDFQGRVLAFGLTALISLQAFYNMLMVVGSMLVTGVSMPFISSGGSVLLVNSLAVGLLMSIDYQTQRARRAQGKGGDLPSVRTAIRQRMVER